MRFLTMILGCVGIAASAQALVVGSGGVVSDWGVTPFSSWAAPAGTWGTGGTQNNYSPVNYPGVGHVPSPGGATGERFDLEAFYARIQGSNFQVLLVTSSPLQNYLSSYNYTYRLGDVFINTDADPDSEFALIAQDTHGSGFAAGQLRSVSSTYGIISGHGGYGGTPAVANIVNPWTLRTGDLMAAGSFASASYTYAAESNHATWLYEWSAPFASLGMAAGSQFRLHVTQECGNDLIELSGTIPPPPPPPPIPEPGTALLAGVALAALGRRLRAFRQS